MLTSILSGHTFTAKLAHEGTVLKYAALRCQSDTNNFDCHRDDWRVVSNRRSFVFNAHRRSTKQQFWSNIPYCFYSHRALRDTCSRPSFLNTSYLLSPYRSPSCPFDFPKRRRDATNLQATLFHAFESFAETIVARIFQNVKSNLVMAFRESVKKEV
jgi:hypothetical protein